MRETLKNSAGENRGGQNRIGRRAVLGGLAGTGLLALPACSTMQGYGLTEAIRRLLLLSSQRAFAQLTAPGGFYDNALNRLELPGQFRSTGHKLADFLASAVFKSRLQKAFNAMAEDGAERAAPLVADAVRGVSIADAAALIRSGPTGATQFLHQAMGATLIEAMVPALAMRCAWRRTRWWGRRCRAWRAWTTWAGWRAASPGRWTTRSGAPSGGRKPRSAPIPPRPAIRC